MGQLINCFKSYLENISQYVSYNEKRSDIKDVISICYNIILRLYHIIFKYVISITLTDIITCSVCKTLYLYVSSVYTVMWHDIIMHSFMSKYLIIDSLQKNLSTYSKLYGQSNVYKSV